MEKNIIYEIDKIKSLMLLNETAVPKPILEFFLSFFPKAGNEFDVAAIKNLTDDELSLIRTRIKNAGTDITDSEVDNMFKALKRDADDIVERIKAGKTDADDIERHVGLGTGPITKVINKIPADSMAAFIKTTKKELLEKSLSTVGSKVSNAERIFISKLERRLESNPTIADSFDDFCSPEALRAADEEAMTLVGRDGAETTVPAGLFTELEEKEGIDIYDILSARMKNNQELKARVEHRIKNRKGKGFKEGSKNTLKQLLSELKEPWEVFAMRIEQTINFFRSDTKIKEMWEKSFNDAMNIYSTNIAKGDYSVKILRDRFLATGRYQQDFMWEDILKKSKADMLERYPNQREAVNKIFSEMESLGTDEGLEFILKNAESSEKILALGKKYKNWLWEFKTPPKSLSDDATRWAKFKNSGFYQLMKKVLRTVLVGSSYSPNQYRIYLAKKGYRKYASMQIEFLRFLNLRVFLPVCAGFAWYLAYAGDEVAGGARRILTELKVFGDWTNSPVEVNYLNDYVWNPIIKRNIDWSNLFSGEDKGWMWFLSGILPGDLDLIILASVSSTKSQEKEEGEWRFKDTKTGEMVKNDNGEEVVFKDLQSATDFYANAMVEKKKYKCVSIGNGCARLTTEINKRKTQSYNDIFKKSKEKVELYFEIRKNSNVRLLESAIEKIKTVLKSSDWEVILPNSPSRYPYFVLEENGIVKFPYNINISDTNQLSLHLNDQGNWIGYRGEAKYEKLSDFAVALVDDIKRNKMMNVFDDDNKDNKPEILKDPIKKESITPIVNKIIKEMKEGKKFGEDNFKHWKDTFKFKKYDEKTNQLKDVKISSKMDEIMDRIDHFRKKYDEDDAFVRAVVDVYGTQIDIIQHTKGLAQLTESFMVEGLMSVLATLRESKELVTWTVKHYKDGNWELVKGNFNKKELLNVGKTKREREERQKDSESPAEGLKKKEQESIMILNRDEKEGLNGLPTKVKQKIKEKLRQGWTTEKPFDFLSDFYTESEINSVFNDKIKIFKLKPSAEFFRSLTKNSAKITIKKGFCKSIKKCKKEDDLNEKERSTLNHFISKCESKFGI